MAISFFELFSEKYVFPGINLVFSHFISLDFFLLKFL